MVVVSAERVSTARGSARGSACRSAVAGTDARSTDTGDTGTCARSGPALLLPGVMKLPGDGVEEADETSLADATAEERVGGQGAEGVVTDLGISGRGAAVDQP